MDGNTDETVEMEVHWVDLQRLQPPCKFGVRKAWKDLGSISWLHFKIKSKPPLALFQHKLEASKNYKSRVKFLCICQSAESACPCQVALGLCLTLFIFLLRAPVPGIPSLQNVNFLFFLIEEVSRPDSISKT